MEKKKRGKYTAPLERCLFEIWGFECFCGCPERLTVGISASDLIPHKCNTSCRPLLLLPVLPRSSSFFASSVMQFLYSWAWKKRKQPLNLDTVAQEAPGTTVKQDLGCSALFKVKMRQSWQKMCERDSRSVRCICNIQGHSHSPIRSALCKQYAIARVFIYYGQFTFYAIWIRLYLQQRWCCASHFATFSFILSVLSCNSDFNQWLHQRQTVLSH